MDFIPPFDQVGVIPPGPWTNASPTAGIQGSIVNADVFPAVQNEILALIDAAGETRSASDQKQALKAIRSGVLSYFADTGTPDALAIAPSPAYTALIAGTEFAVLKSNLPNATTTPTLTVNGLTQTIVKEDGNPLLVGDLPAFDLFTVRSDGSKFRVQGLRKSDISAAVAGSTIINSTTQNYIDKSTPRGSTKLSAFTANVVVSDIAVTPSFTSVQLTGAFTGATYVDASATCALHDNAGNTFEGSGTARLQLNDLTLGTSSQSNYVGGGSFSQGTQISLVVPRFIFDLDSTHSYNLQLMCQKGTGVGQAEIFDTYIFSQHDGTNI